MAKSNKTTVSKSTAAKDVAANKEKIAAAIEPQNQQATAQPIKADIARKIFEEAYADPKAVPPRKAILARFQAEAGLTEAGAATYLQNMKKKAGYVVPRQKVAPVAEATTEAPTA